ncbi:MAG: hypothetical protein JW699_04435 [Chitinispirillaceae bacterium]|nr:hypothetical protein [Chitinispirillaceae bacterium]
MYRKLDSCNALNAELLIKWVRCRELLGRYAGSVELYCRLMEAEPRFDGVVYGRLHQLFEDAPRDSIGAALAAFERCALGRRGIDTLGARLRLARCYAGFGLDSAELSVLAAASGPPAKTVPKFMEMARERYAGRRYAAAIRAATLAYERGSGRVKTGAADLLSRSYRSLRRYDSALVWITRSDLSNESRKTDAAALYQHAGRLAEAGELIGTLSRSFGRDTLELRQYLYGGDTRGAREFAQKAFAARPQLPDEAMLWKARTLLFDGAFDGLSALLDTVVTSSSRPVTALILECRLMLKSLRNSDAALAAWSRQEYEVFAGKAGRAAARLSGQEVPSDCRTVLTVRFVKELLARGDTSAAADFFDRQSGNIDAPEYLYLYAEHLLRAAGPEQAGTILLRVIKDYPDDVFSDKSRVLLAKINKKNQ